MNIPEACPGTKSEVAGKASACAGCPNQKICASGAAKQPDPDIPLITTNLAKVQHRILILSGKGGVGKSTVASQIALLLAFKEGKNVGMLDVDLCGPSQPRMLGCVDAKLHGTFGGSLVPVYVDAPDSVETGSLAVVSIGFLLEDEGDAVIWRGARKNGMLKKFLRDVSWTEESQADGDQEMDGQQIEYLVVDTPPGTSDEHLTLVSLVKPITGAVLVSTPQEVAWQDVRKEADFCRKTGIPILGVIENMAGFVCPSCSFTSELFPSKQTAKDKGTRIEKWAEENRIPYLGAVPLDPRVGKHLDSGKPFVLECPETPAAKAFSSIVANLVDIVNNL